MNKITVEVGDIVKCRTSQWETKPMLLVELNRTKKGYMGICQAYMSKIDNNQEEYVPAGNRVGFPADRLYKAKVTPAIGKVEEPESLNNPLEGNHVL